MSFSNFENGPNSSKRGNQDEADTGPETLPFSWQPYPVLPPPKDAPTGQAPRRSLKKDAGAAPVSSVSESSVQSSGALHTIRTAAAHMGVDPVTLRAQCRNATRDGGVADLGGGIIAFKIGRHWRVRFPWWQ